jgi:nucleoside-diphosphate-sugar epimerase
MTTRAVVTGAGGFIGHHLVSYLKGRGYWVRGVDTKEPEYQASAADEFLVRDLRLREHAAEATADVSEVYNLAADMGGIGYITAERAVVASNNVLIDAHLLEAAHQAGAERFFYSSSACIYPQYRQETPSLEALKEEDAYPADPEEGYGWEKLYAEKLAQYYEQEGRLRTRVARFHNVYGPYGSYDGGREKAPAAISRKIALAPDPGEIEVWGDGQQTRSFMYVDDCVEGIHRIIHSEHWEPLNLGTEELITVNDLVDLIAKIAEKEITKRHDTTKPQGVRGRNSDNTRLRETLGWEPSISLETGLRETYRWIESELRSAGRSEVD